MSTLKPFKVKPYIVWAFVIGLLLFVTFASTRSNYEPSVPSSFETNRSGSPTEVVPSQIPDDSPTPAPETPANLFPEPLDTMKDYDHSTLSLQPLDWSGKKAVRMISLEESDESMYPASLDEVFAASEHDGFMQASVDTLFDVNALKPPRLMTDQV
jgi:hypothetical protein